ncbi:uncharacterized protein LOC125531344 [Triticum urartu]|nr:uncharacterized protein LOC125531344 [Triticum urartu]
MVPPSPGVRNFRYGMPHLDRVSRSAYASMVVMARNIAVKGENTWGKSNWLCCPPCCSNYFCTSTYANGDQSAIAEAMDRAEMKGRTSSRVYTAHILNNTTHRDGSIYKKHSGFLGLWPLTRCDESSVIGMTGPKRYIATLAPVLVEFDMRIKKGEQEEDDLQLIDGAIEYGNLCTSEYPFTDRINGDCGTVDITLALVRWAFEATIDVTVSKVQSRFDLSLSSFVFIIDGLHEIKLFRGSIGESYGLRRHVIAVKEDTWMHLKFKVGQRSCKNDGDLDRHCSFKAKKHGYDCQQIMLELASISVKVTWSNVRTAQNYKSTTGQ